MAEYPKFTLIRGTVDICLTNKKYIYACICDYGDRFFGTNLARISWLFLWCLDVELLILESVLEGLDHSLKKIVFDWWEDSKGTILYLGKPIMDFAFHYKFAINFNGHLMD